jgi:UDP-N-acetyl-D-mannosaminuronic acid dehydrogenase
LKNYTLAVHDPHVKHSPIPLSSQDEALQEADCLVILTAHDEFKKIDPEQIQSRMRHKIVLDTHNILPADVWSENGFTVITLGKGN